MIYLVLFSFTWVNIKKRPAITQKRQARRMYIQSVVKEQLGGSLLGIPPGLMFIIFVK